MKVQVVLLTLCLCSWFMAWLGFRSEVLAIQIFCGIGFLLFFVMGLFVALGGGDNK